MLLSKLFLISFKMNQQDYDPSIDWRQAYINLSQNLGHVLSILDKNKTNIIERISELKQYISGLPRYTPEIGIIVYVSEINYFKVMSEFSSMPQGMILIYWHRDKDNLLCTLIIRDNNYDIFIYGKTLEVNRQKYSYDPTFIDIDFDIQEKPMLNAIISYFLNTKLESDAFYVKDNKIMTIN